MRAAAALALLMLVGCSGCVGKKPSPTPWEICDRACAEDEGTSAGAVFYGQIDGGPIEPISCWCHKKKESI